MEELSFHPADQGDIVESNFVPLFKKAQVYSFGSTGLWWADTWILPLQANDGTFTFLLIDSLTYQTLDSQDHFLMGFASVKESIQAARIYLGQCANRFLTTFDSSSQKWPPLC
jgi:hypothetical protein